MNIQKILTDHSFWLAGKGGQCANLSGANLSHANLSGANLSGAKLSHANLFGADLSDANLSGANLYNANLSDADLFCANLSGAKLSHANLFGADLSGANLSDADLFCANLYNANLSGADLSHSRGFAPTMLLLAQWGELSDNLCRLAMAYDASAHHNSAAFDLWKETGRCPYADTSYQRVCNFRENRDLWDSTVHSPRTWDLMVKLIREKCANSDWHEK